MRSPTWLGCALVAALVSSACASSETRAVPPKSTSTPAAVSFGGVPSSWHLVENENFSAGALNPGLWAIGDPWERNTSFVSGPDSVCPVAGHSELVSVKAGELIMKAKKQTPPATKLASCNITTRDHFSLTHGYLETRVKLPSSPGLWSSFWLLGNGTGANGWPGTGEIDVFEFVNNGSENGVPFVTLHFAGACPEGHCVYRPVATAPLSNYAGRWITVGLLRTASAINVYVDGEQIAGVRPSHRNPNGVALPALLFDSPMHVRLDLKAGGWANDAHDPTQPGTLQVDYVRAWSP